MGDELRAGMCAACAVLASSMRRHRGSRLLRFAAVVIFMLTLISFVSTLTNSLSYISSAALKF